jgi:hypothetical protein
MTSLRRLLFLAGLLALGSRVDAAPPLTNLVDNQTPLLVSIHDLPSLLKNWEQSPWAKTWNDEQMKKFLAPLRTQMKIAEWDEQAKNETGYTVGELLALAKGDALLAIKNLDFAATDAQAKDAPFLVAVELGDNTSKIESLIAEAEKKQQGTTHEVEDFAGVSVHSSKQVGKEGPNTTAVWAFVDGIGLLSPSKDTVIAAIDAVKRGGVDNPLGQSESFMRVRQRTSDAQLVFYANAQVIVPVIQKAIAEKSAAAGGNQANPLGIDPASLLSALGLDAINEIYFAGQIGAEQTETYFGLNYTELRGILKMLAYRDGPPKLPSFVPVKAVSAGAGNFSLRDAYVALEETIENVSPVISGMFQGQIKNYNKQLGIDLKRDLIGSLGSEYAMANLRPASAPAEAAVPLTEMEQLYAISLENPTAFTSAIEALKRLFLGPQADQVLIKRDYLGSTIYSFKAPEVEGRTRPGAKSFAYAITKNYLFVGIGSAAPVEAALQGLSGGQPSLWDQPDVKRAFADVPANASSFQYEDTRVLIAALIETIVRTAPLFASTPPAADADDEDESKPKQVHPAAKRDLPFDLSAKPDAAVIGRYWSYAYGYGVRESNGLYAKSTLIHPK